MSWAPYLGPAVSSAVETAARGLWFGMRGISREQEVPEIARDANDGFDRENI